MKKILFALLIILILILFGVAAGLFYKNHYLKAKSQTASDDNIVKKTVATIPTTPPPEKVTTFSFAGDMMFDRYVNHKFKDIGFDHVFDNLDKSLFASQDIRFANLEGPVSDQPITDDYPERSLVFNMPTGTIQAIKNLGLNGVSLANNHTLNAGKSGFTTTQELLATADISYAGSQDDFDEDNVLEYNTEIPVSIICVDYLSFQNNDKIDAIIKTEKAKNYFVIVFPHWGTEYSLTHDKSQENAADNWINNGADLIVGSHPHVVEDIDIFDNKLIIYSLGNFVFDQTFSTDTQQGLIVSGRITDKNLELTFYPIESVKLQPKLATPAISSQILGRIIDSGKFSSISKNGNTIDIER